MVSESLCAYCQQLPVLSKTRSGKPSRCPLCKSSLWLTGDGTTYRVPDDQENQDHPHQPHWWRRLAGMISLWLLATAAALGVYWSRGSSETVPAARPSVQAPVFSQSAVIATGAEAQEASECR